MVNFCQFTDSECHFSVETAVDKILHVGLCKMNSMLVLVY